MAWWQWTLVILLAVVAIVGGCMSEIVHARREHELWELHMRQHRAKVRRLEQGGVSQRRRAN